MSGFAVGQRMRVRPGYLFAGKVVTIRDLITDDPDEPVVIEAVFAPGDDLTIGRVGEFTCTLLQDEMWFTPKELEPHP